MTEKKDQQQTAMQRWGSQKKPWWAWTLFFLITVPLIGIGLAWFANLGQSPQELKAELNARYVEDIDVKYRDIEDLIVIDGVSRYDCSEKDGYLTCDEDPQPTEQREP